MISPHSRSARDLARHLLDTDARPPAEPEALAESAERVCERLTQHLSRWIGVVGADTLFARAFAHAQSEHTPLRAVRYSRTSAPRLEGLAESARLHGATAITESVEGILTALIDLLGRLIGDDMAMQLIEQGARPGTPGDASSTGGENSQ